MSGVSGVRRPIRNLVGPARFELATSCTPSKRQASTGRTDQMDDALREYETVLRIRPDLSGAHLDLGDRLAGEGDLAGATPHLRNAARSADPALRALAEQLMQELGIRP
jgi:hypothetical protein